MLNILQSPSNLTFKITLEIRNHFIHFTDEKTELGWNLSCGIFSTMILDIFHLSDSSWFQMPFSFFYVVLM
jgi:hypothetical protein